MSTELIAFIALASLLVLILVEVPVGIAITFAGTIGVVLLYGYAQAGTVLGATAYTSTAKYALLVVPMYVLLGCVVANAGIGAGIYRVTNKVVGRFPGGLAATAVAATSVFSGISGSSAADVATFGRVSVTEMARHGYSKAEAAAVVAAAGAFAVLIPPSIVLIIYGIIAQVSIGALLLAAIIPGVLSALALMTFVIVRAFVRQRLGWVPEGETAAASTMSSATEVASGVLVAGEEIFEVEADGRGPRAWLQDGLAVMYAAIIFLIVIGGLYSGIFTATEAGAVGALAALIIALVARGSRSTSVARLLTTSMRETVDVTSMIFLLLLGGSVFTFFLASSGLADDMASWALGLPVSPHLVVALFLVLLIPLGMFLDGLSILLLTVPLAAPVVMDLGFDGIWFGILMIKMIEIGLLTPPVGINVFIISGIAGIPAEKIFRQTLPFVILDLCVTAFIFSVPGVVTWLPNLAGVG